MSKIFISIFISLLTFSAYSKTPAEYINNWNKLSTDQQLDATYLVSSIYGKNTDFLNEFKIAMNMTYYSTDLTKKYKGEYSNSKAATVVVGYVPLQFVEYYEADLQSFYNEKKQNKNVVPRLDVILAIHYTEGNFIPSAVAGTERNPSFGMMQLTLRSAMDLMDDKYKGEYNEFFKIIDRKVIFDSTEAQIALTIKFLTEIKKYTREYETDAVARYNGSGENAIEYASKVLNRARLYRKMKAEGAEISTKEFIAEYTKPEVKEAINNQLQAKGYEPLTDGEYKEAIDKAIGVYEYVPSATADDIVLPALGNGEIKKVPNNHVKFPPIPNDGCEYYLKIEEGRTLYSYFLNTKDMVYNTCNEKNQAFSVFYNTKSGKKVLKSLYDIDVKNDKMQTDVKAGDIIYLSPDIVIKGDVDTYANLSRICPEKQ